MSGEWTPDPIVANLVQMAANIAMELARAADTAGQEADGYRHARLAKRLEQLLHEERSP